MDKNSSFWKRNRMPLILLGAGLLIAAVVYPFLPDTLPMQFNMNGEVSRYGGKWEIFIVGALPAVVWWGIRRKYGKRNGAR